MKRAVSPIIATVILIAVAVALGIAVAVWAGALTSGLTNVEKLVVQANAPTDNVVTLTIYNQSPKTTTISAIFFNNVAENPFTQFMINSGDTASVNITVTNGHSGVNYGLVIETTAGNSYPASVTLP